MNLKCIVFTLVALFWVGCSTTKNYEIRSGEVFSRIEAMQPQLVECFKKHEPEEKIDSLSLLEIEGPLETNGKFRYVDVHSKPLASKSTQACIEKLMTDEQFSTQPSAVTIKFKFSLNARAPH